MNISKLYLEVISQASTILYLHLNIYISKRELHLLLTTLTSDSNRPPREMPDNMLDGTIETIIFILLADQQSLKQSSGVTERYSGEKKNFTPLLRV